MDSRTRMLTALNNEKPDRLPCQVHGWQRYYLETHLGGIDQFAAYEKFDMDYAIYVEPSFGFASRDLANWEQSKRTITSKAAGRQEWQRTITTPKGVLTDIWAADEYTSWAQEHLIKGPSDFEIWNAYIPIPESVDWNPVIAAKNKLGNRGIVRGSFFDFGQGSPWQSLCFMMGIEQAITAAIDEPSWVHHALQAILDKKLKVIERAGRFALDLVETGGGAGSSTVISPYMFNEFCVPYDNKQHAALQAAGTKVVYHLCGGLMPMLSLVAQNGANGLETMTPPNMGGDCDLAAANKQVGDRLFFVGGFDQQKGFEKGNPQSVREMVFELHRACPDGGYICSPSDHFFFGDPENIKAFAAACKECTY